MGEGRDSIDGLGLLRIAAYRRNDENHLSFRRECSASGSALTYDILLGRVVPVTIAIVFHMFIAPSFTLIDVSLVLSVYSAYRIIVSDSIEQSLHQQRQIASQSASIAVLQTTRTPPWPTSGSAWT